MLTKTLQIEILKFLGWKIFHILCPLHSGVGRIKDLELVEVGLGRPIYCLTGYWTGFHIEIREHSSTRNTFILAVRHQDESNYVESELKLIRVQTNNRVLVEPGVACWRDASRRWELLRLVPTGSLLLPHFTQECGGHLSHYPRHARCAVILLNGAGILRLAGLHSDYWGFYQNQAISQLRAVGPRTPRGAWDWDKM